MSNSSHQARVEATSSDDHSPSPIASKNFDDVNQNMKGLVIVYKECLKNHAASLGGNTRDGCGEFMMSTGVNNLNCSACGCHRNFHRRTMDAGGSNVFSPGYFPRHPYPYCWNTSPTPMIHQEVMQCHQTKGLLRARLGPQELMGPDTTSPQEEKMEGNEGGAIMKIEGNGGSKKRHRTRFTSEQKEKMQEIAEIAEWKIQKLDEGSVLQLCQELNIKRRVFKVWMRNNRHHYVNKDVKASTNYASLDHTTTDA